MKILKRFFIYSLIGIIVSITSLYYVNDVLLGEDKNITSSSQNLDTSEKITSTKKEEVNIPKESLYASMFNDDKNISYINNGILYIINTKDNSILKEIHEKKPIIYAKVIDYKGRILYAVNNGTNMEIKTYIFETDEVLSQVKIPCSASAGVQSVDFSNLTNNIYVSLKVGSTNDVYKINIMKDAVKVYSNKTIERSDMLRKSGDDAFIFQSTDGSIVIGSKYFTYDNYTKGFKLVGTDKEDNIYILNKALNKMYTVKDNKVKSEMSMKSEEAKQIINADGNLYIIFNDYIYDISKNKIVNKTIDGKIISISESSFLYKSSDGKIYKEENGGL